MQKFGKNRDKQKVAMAKLDHHIADVRLESVETGRTRAYGDAAEYKSHLPDMRLFLKNIARGRHCSNASPALIGQTPKQWVQSHQRARAKLVSLWGV